ncbi:hypothetical protein DSUL_50108 [Desulfovibrionales bacterium]
MAMLCSDVLSSWPTFAFWTLEGREFIRAFDEYMNFAVIEEVAWYIACSQSLYGTLGLVGFVYAVAI